MDDVTRLVEQSRDGDLGAYSEVVGRFQDRTVAFALGRLVDPELARVAAERAFVEAWVGFARLRECRAFATWFRRLLVRQCDRVRPSDRVRRGSAAVAAPEGALAGVGEGGGVVKAMASFEAPQRLPAAVAALPPKLRSAILLHDVGDLSISEMAAFLGLSTVAIKRRLLAGRARLPGAHSDPVGAALRRLRPSRGGRFRAGVVELLAVARAGDADVLHTRLRARGSEATVHPFDRHAARGRKEEIS